MMTVIPPSGDNGYFSAPTSTASLSTAPYSHVDQPCSEEPSEDTTSGMPGHGEQAKDDTAIFSRPSRQVDYLSHVWREEDVWSSWRYIVARREDLPTSARLENASWRAWMKVKNDLKTTPPESLNWLKVFDVTWLYGPLQSGRKVLHCTQIEPSSMSLSKNDSYVDFSKTSILKKRTLSEVMLQRQLPAASLLKQAAASPNAADIRGMLRRHLGRSTTNYLSCSLLQRQSYEERSSATLSTASYGTTATNAKRKSVRFDEHVEQCIIVEVEGDNNESDDNGSNYGVMMKRIKTKRSPLPRQKALKSKPARRKTIAMLPPTTLKHWESMPEPRETAMEHSRNPAISSAPSHGILQRTAPSSKLLFGEEDKNSLDDSLVSPSSDSASHSPPTEGVTGGLHQSISWVGWFLSRAGP